jgi:hypothetical protein
LRPDVVRHTKYKTKLCQKYWIAGYCAYGPRCNFVHDEAEKSKKEDDYLPLFNPATQPPSVIRRAVLLALHARNRHKTAPWSGTCLTSSGLQRFGLEARVILVVTLALKSLFVR